MCGFCISFDLEERIVVVTSVFKSTTQRGVDRMTTNLLWPLQKPLIMNICYSGDHTEGKATHTVCIIKLDWPVKEWLPLFVVTVKGV